MRNEAWLLALGVALLAACGVTNGGTASPDSGASNGTGATDGAVVDGGGTRPSADAAAPTGADGGSGEGDGPDAGASHGGDGASDAAPPVPLDGGTTFVVAQPIAGTPSPTKSPLHGPGLILMGGGTDVDAAFVWMHDTLVGSSSATGGNVLVFNTQSPPPSLDNAYTSYIAGLAPFQSVQTLYLGGYKNDGNGAPAATVADVEIAAYYVSQADAVFFAGGDQADYVSWYETSPALATAIAALYARGGVIGGTSAGCAVMGPYVFDDLAADDQSADPATADVVANPYESSISFTRNMFTFPSIPRVFTDPHFVTRDRFGRLAGFVARQYADGFAPAGVVGVGVDESNALVVDAEGLATLYQQPSGTEDATGTGAYVIRPGGPAATCVSGQALVYDSLTVTRLSKGQTATVTGDTFDFAKGCGSGVSFTVSVDGANASSPYSTSPYTATGQSVACP